MEWRGEEKRTEQNRRKQNRTEQNRTEQNRTEEQKNRREQKRTEENRREQSRKLSSNSNPIAPRRFAGALETFTIEGVMQNGWGLQMGTSHYLGQNFGKAFGVEFMNQNNARETVWGASWGVSTRLIGGLIMSHSDDIGLVLPPKIAPVQVVVVPIYKGKKSTTEDDEKMKVSGLFLKTMSLHAKMRGAWDN